MKRFQDYFQTHNVEFFCYHKKIFTHENEIDIIFFYNSSMFYGRSRETKEKKKYVIKKHTEQSCLIQFLYSCLFQRETHQTQSQIETRFQTSVLIFPIKSIIFIIL